MLGRSCRSRLPACPRAGAAGRISSDLTVPGRGIDTGPSSPPGRRRIGWQGGAKAIASPRSAPATRSRPPACGPRVVPLPSAGKLAAVPFQPAVRCWRGRCDHAAAAAADAQFCDHAGARDLSNSRRSRKPLPALAVGRKQISARLGSFAPLPFRLSLPRSPKLR